MSERLAVIESEADAIYRALNGLDIQPAAKRVDHIMEQVLEGARIGDGNRRSIRDYLLVHFRAAESAAWVRGNRHE